MYSNGREQEGAVFVDRRARSGIGQVQALNFGGVLRLRRSGEREAFILAMICALDMMTTLWWFVNGEATEANPLLAWALHAHPVWFVLVKCATFLPALLLLVRLGAHRPLMVRWTLRVAIVLYLLIYLISVS